MPIRVDHRERRKKIAEATASVISREGLDSAKIRRIAEEIGGPTSRVTHYFPDKDRLLRFTFEDLVQSARSLPGSSAADPGPVAEPGGLGAQAAAQTLVDTLIAMAAADRGGVQRWRAFLAFWDQDVRDPSVAGLRRACMEHSIQHIAGLVRAILGDRPEVEPLSLVFQGVAVGISMQVLLDPGRWSPDAMRTLFEALVMSLLSDERSREALLERLPQTSREAPGA
jgi:AcrR family transcriptional regulator